MQRLTDWGPIEQADNQTNDWRTADLAAQFLRQEHDKPFFLGCGIYRPHLSWYIPKRYFAMHPIEKVQLPPHKEDDLDDVPPMGRRMAGTSFTIIRKHGQWKSAVQGYLAACSFADARPAGVGRSFRCGGFCQPSVSPINGAVGAAPV